MAIINQERKQVRLQQFHEFCVCDARPASQPHGLGGDPTSQAGRSPARRSSVTVTVTGSHSLTCEDYCSTELLRPISVNDDNQGVSFFMSVPLVLSSGLEQEEPIINQRRKKKEEEELFSLLFSSALGANMQSASQSVSQTDSLKQCQSQSQSQLAELTQEQYIHQQASHPASPVLATIVARICCRSCLMRGECTNVNALGPMVMDLVYSVLYAYSQAQMSDTDILDTWSKTKSISKSVGEFSHVSQAYCTYSTTPWSWTPCGTWNPVDAVAIAIAIADTRRLSLEPWPCSVRGAGIHLSACAHTKRVRVTISNNEKLSTIGVLYFAVNHSLTQQSRSSSRNHKFKQRNTTQHPVKHTIYQSINQASKQASNFYFISGPNVILIISRKKAGLELVCIVYIRTGQKYYYYHYYLQSVGNFVLFLGLRYTLHWSKYRCFVGRFLGLISFYGAFHSCELVNRKRRLVSPVSPLLRNITTAYSAGLYHELDVQDVFQYK
ncbi:hypothetical protein T310_2574 [Rasamsonia emersonii CBS 393.64]|uniref:Uncharacterized protein n=1 Tax=Rasamsonia emersonii (strain ATCC 16479 / CBS 393.64 / IMI 116815) TaxID=1408163 RepID=A0A0F4YZY0_RASE3|nr:hypothetical protein T310_2574 [Rasamsonia emersonii CBS 393.64]KKA23401.1 hypothetical protein T310_2574 [Rasamsonia emersonii CBS 393.64]